MNSDDIGITRPCPIDIAAMVRSTTRPQIHCGHCQRAVHILTNMSEAAAEATMARRPSEGLCVAYVHDANGELRRSAKLVPLTRLARTRQHALRGVVMAMSLASCTPHGSDRADPIERIAWVTPSQDSGMRVRAPALPERSSQPHSTPAAIIFVTNPQVEFEPEDPVMAGAAWDPDPSPDPPVKVEETFYAISGGAPGPTTLTPIRAPPRRDSFGILVKPTAPEPRFRNRERVTRPFAKVMDRSLYTPVPSASEVVAHSSAHSPRQRQVVTRFCIDTTGHTFGISTSRSSGDAPLDTLIRGRIASWRFRPERDAAKPVDVCTKHKLLLKRD